MVAMSGSHMPRKIGRRSLLGAGGGAAAAVLLAACSSESTSDSTTSTTEALDASSVAPSTSTGGSGGGTSATTDDLSTGTPSTTVFRAADFAALGTCLLSPEQTEGPYPTKDPIERRDLREDLVGHPLRLGLQVVDESCAPIPGAVVEIWHCDTDGDYSEYADGGTQDDAAEGTTFLRGSQTANDEGIVEFITNYPGWYRGRAVHIHTKVHLEDTTVLTSQIFFADEQNSAIFTEAPYSAHGDPDTSNEEDSIAGGDPADSGTEAHTADDDELSGTRGLLVLGVDPDAESTGGAGAGPGGGRRGGPGGGPPSQ